MLQAPHFHFTSVRDGRARGRMLPLDSMLECLRLKALPRAGWVRKGVPGGESVASHSWGLSWLVLTLLPPALDRGRALAYAAIHDLPEVRVGDLTPADGVSKEDKSRRERLAMSALAAGLGSAGLLALYEAYEAQADPESRFVRELDRLDMALQALAHHEAGWSGMAEFVASAAGSIQDPVLRAWIAAIQARFASIGVR
jgi:putative hydrolase of HD superfamily